jgi:hypothetical protein
MPWYLQSKYLIVSGDHSAFASRIQIDQAEATLLLVTGRGISLLVEIAERPVVLEVIVPVALVEDVVTVGDDRRRARRRS